jgi:hypothetical protein
VLDCEPFETGDQELPAIQKLTIALDSRLHQVPSLRFIRVPMPKIWNFSNLTHLEIRNGCTGDLERLENFLSIVFAEQPSGIGSFTVLSSQHWGPSVFFDGDFAARAKVKGLLGKILETIDHLREFKLAWSFAQRLSFILPKHHISQTQLFFSLVLL